MPGDLSRADLLLQLNYQSTDTCQADVSPADPIGRVNYLKEITNTSGKAWTGFEVAATDAADIFMLTGDEIPALLMTFTDLGGTLPDSFRDTVSHPPRSPSRPT